jgi:hypothetical protein
MAIHSMASVPPSYYHASAAIPIANHSDFFNTHTWVLKKSVIGMSFGLRLSLLPSFLFSPQLSGSFHSGGGRLAEEPHQSLEVLGCRCQEELLTNEHHPA